MIIIEKNSMFPRVRQSTDLLLYLKITSLNKNLIWYLKITSTMLVWNKCEIQLTFCRSVYFEEAAPSAVEFDREWKTNFKTPI